jgi:SAM-dependent methyltransferase
MDFVVASEVLEHLTDEQRAAGIGEIARILRPGGYFLGTVPFNENLAEQQAVCPHCGEVFHRWGHQRSFTLDDVRHQLAPHFRVDELRKTAFVSFRGRSLLGKAKSAVRLLLARAGQPIAVPTIFWLAEVRSP